MIESLHDLIYPDHRNYGSTMYMGSCARFMTSTVINYSLPLCEMHRQMLQIIELLYSKKSSLFYSVLFYSILFYSILFYSILFYSILFYSILFY